jgi:hypothetical protein
MSNATLSPHLLRKLAVETCSDPRTVQKVISGGRVADMTRERVSQALRGAGYGYLLSSQKGDDGQPRSAA